MFIFNVKLNNKKAFKFLLCFLVFIAIIILVIATIKLFTSTSNLFNKDKDNIFIKDEIVKDSYEVAKLTKENYTNILEEVHTNIDKYIGQKISFSGYVYRVNGFNENQFVLARDMNIGNNQKLIVGFLCEANNAKDFTTYSWVELTGEITKSTFNNSPIPLLKVTNLTASTKPEDSLVYPPDSSFVATSTIY